MRDGETGYYSAAVLDFDNNSVEATHREKVPERSDRSDVSKEDQRVLSWQKDVAQSSTGSNSQVDKPTSRVMINNITNPTTVVSRIAPAAKEDGEMNAKALVGTLLGAAAGAAVAYAMTKGEAESARSHLTQTITCQTIEANNPRRAPSTLSSRQSYPSPSSSHGPRIALRELEYPNVPNSVIDGSEISKITSSLKRLPAPTASAGQLLASTLIDTFVPPSEIRPFAPHGIARSHTDGALTRSTVDQPSQAASRHSKTSHTSSAVKTVTQVDRRSATRSPVMPEINLAKEVPLPVSGATSHVSRHTTASHPKDTDMKSELQSVAPSDSVSQAGSRRSKGSERSIHHGRSRSGLEAVQEDSGSRASERTIRDRGSRTRKRMESAVSLPMKPSSKASAHRSVKSFIPGL